MTVDDKFNIAVDTSRSKESSPNIDQCTQSQSPHLFETHVCSFGTLDALDCPLRL